jgi:hypothetical protein
MRNILVLDAVVFWMLTIFNAWNWFLAFKGRTTIEFMQEKGGARANPLVSGFKTVSDNLFLIFGTHKPLRILSPSLRNNPFTGLEWSFLVRDNGFECDADEYRAGPELMAENDRLIKEMYPPGSEALKKWQAQFATPAESYP